MSCDAKKTGVTMVSVSAWSVVMTFSRSSTLCGARLAGNSACASHTYQVPLVHVTVMTNSARMVSEANKFVF